MFMTPIMSMPTKSVARNITAITTTATAAHSIATQTAIVIAIAPVRQIAVDRPAFLKAQSNQSCCC
jgi:hypothetical protein